ncbi:hypothetical protein AMOR_31930 [Anaeromyxobacter oryzae]|uniref:histidine kinase n=2 Tax=Anaeromyxobacter oryzae TaxID=2918170 RepID=A0ABN6MTA2_9BACT|nr:hypothetical protein AMOR_31930 [Anaeromyxobacter oryzae]
MVTNAAAGLRWISRPAPELQEATEALERIVADGHRARELIDSIRAMFQKESADKALLNLNDVIWEALALLRGELQSHGVTVRTELSEALPPVRGDHVQLQQVLVNLVTNAIESMATRRGARSLCLGSSVDASGVTVAVADNGKGLEPTEYERVFDPLFTTKPHGMGMGLAICRSIIEGHEGRLWASANEPRGAVFRFTLPASAGGLPRDANRTVGVTGSSAWPT